MNIAVRTTIAIFYILFVIIMIVGASRIFKLFGSNDTAENRIRLASGLRCMVDQSYIAGEDQIWIRAALVMCYMQITAMFIYVLLNQRLSKVILFCILSQIIPTIIVHMLLASDDDWSKTDVVKVKVVDVPGQPAQPAVPADPDNGIAAKPAVPEVKEVSHMEWRLARPGETPTDSMFCFESGVKDSTITFLMVVWLLSVLVNAAIILFVLATTSDKRFQKVETALGSIGKKLTPSKPAPAPVPEISKPRNVVKTSP